jgi:Protein of unknown function (DUF3352)
MTRRVGMRSMKHPVISAISFFMLVVMLANGALFAAPSARAADTPLDTAALAPDSALVYISLTYDTQSDQWQKASALMETLGLGSLEDALASSSDATSEVSAEDLQGSEIGFVITNLDFASNTASGISSLTGDLASPTAAVSQASSNEGVITIVKPANPVRVWAGAQRDMLKDARTSGATVDSTTYEGVTIESIPGDEAAGVDASAQALVGDSIVVGTTVEDVESIIDVSTGKTAPLSDSNAFKQLEPKLQQEFLVFGFVNGPALDAAGMTEGNSSLESLSSVSVLKAYTAFVAYVVESGLRFDSLSVNEDGSSPMPAASGFAPSFASKVPDDTLLFVDGNDLRQTGVLDALGLAIAQGIVGIDTSATPTAGESQEDFENEIYTQAEGVLGFNIKTDLIDQIKGEYGLAIWGANMDDPSNLGALFVTGVENQATVQDVVSKISLLAQSAGSGQFTVTTRTIGNSVIQSIDLSSSGFPLSLDYGVINNELVISLGNGLDTFTNGSTSSLADSAQYSTALGALPANPTTIAYLDTAQLFPILESFLGPLSGASAAATPDAGEKCAEYNSQAAAQAELDAEGGFSFDLDQDFDGQACEDYFATPEPMASPTPEFNYKAIKSFTLVTYEKDGLAGASALLVIG